MSKPKWNRLSSRSIVSFLVAIRPVRKKDNGVERTEEIIHLVHKVEKEVDTVISLGVGTRCDENGDEKIVAPILERLGYKIERAKTNMGLGKITNPAKTELAEEHVGQSR